MPDDQMRPDEYLKDELRVFVVPVDIFNVPNLTIYEQMMYMALRSHCSARDMTAFPSYATLAKESRMSRRQAIRAVEGLLACGLLEKQQQFRVSKHKQIQNTSNLYTIKSPSRVVTDSHQGVVTNSHQSSDPQTPRVVTDSHQGSDRQSPKQNHLTNPSEQAHLNNNEHAVVVQVIEELLGTSAKSLLPALRDWMVQFGPEYIVQKARYISADRTKWENVLGAFRTAVLENWQVNEVAATQERDERYKEFYKLFPDT